MRKKNDEKTKFIEAVREQFADAFQVPVWMLRDGIPLEEVLKACCNSREKREKRKISKKRS